MYLVNISHQVIQSCCSFYELVALKNRPRRTPSPLCRIPHPKTLRYTFSGVEGGAGRAVLEDAHRIRSGTADGDGCACSEGDGKGAICRSDLNLSDLITGCGERSNSVFINDDTLFGYAFPSFPAIPGSDFNGYASRPPRSISFILAPASRL